MTTATTWVGLRLDPLDTLFFRDGRPFDAANRVVGGLPNPQTLAGALRTTLLGASGFFARNERAHLATILAKGDPAVTGAEFRGPFLALAKGDALEPLFEVPLVVARDKDKEWVRRAPGSATLSGWNDPDGLGLRPVVWEKGGRPDAKGEAPWLTLAGVKAVLSGGTPDEKQVVERAQLSDHDNRTGIVIDTNSLATVEGQLYGIRLLSLNPDIKEGDWKGWKVCLYAEMRPGAGGSLDCAAALNGTPVPFGGEGKYVRATTVAKQDWPKFEPAAKSSLWYLATPTFLPFRETSRRPLPSNVAAAVSGPGIPVSGWDVARRGPNATRFAVPAGACYFLDAAGDPNGFLDATLSDIKNLRQSGWGFALQGTWED